MIRNNIGITSSNPDNMTVQANGDLYFTSLDSDSCSVKEPASPS